MSLVPPPGLGIVYGKDRGLVLDYDPQDCSIIVKVWEGGRWVWVFSFRFCLTLESCASVQLPERGRQPVSQRPPLVGVVQRHVLPTTTSKRRRGRKTQDMGEKGKVRTAKRASLHIHMCVGRWVCICVRASAVYE